MAQGCTPCAQGYYSVGFGNVACTACTATNSLWNAECSVCPANTYDTKEGSTHLEFNEGCEDCPASKYSIGPGASACSHWLISPRSTATVPSHNKLNTDFLSPMQVYISICLGAVCLNWALRSMYRCYTGLRHSPHRLASPSLKGKPAPEIIACEAAAPRWSGVNTGYHSRQTATYDRSTEEFILNTPNGEDHKMWITFAAEHAQLAMVYAVCAT